MKSGRPFLSNTLTFPRFNCSDSEITISHKPFGRFLFFPCRVFGKFFAASFLGFANNLGQRMEMQTLVKT